MARGKGSASAAAKATQTATTRTASGGAMASAAGLELLEEARKEAAAMTPLEVAQLPRIALSQLAPHPDNPEHRHYSEEELEELKNDIENRGVITPVIITTRAAIVEKDPSMADRIPESAIAALMDGNRRWGASLLAEGVDDIPYLLREEFADPATATELFLASSIHSMKLTPIEEADGFARLMRQANINQEEAARRIGVGQPRVSKALQLLKLPPTVQHAVAAGPLSPNAARRLLNLPADRQEDAYLDAMQSLSEADRGRQERVGEAVKVAVTRAKAQIEKDAAVAAARAGLESDGVQVIVDPKELFGVDDWRHEVRENELQSVRDAGELAGAFVHDTGRITFYSTPPAPRHRVAEPVVAEPKEDHADGYSNGISAPELGEERQEYSNGIPSEPEEREQPPATDAPDVEAVERALRAANAAHDERMVAMRRVVADLDPAVLADTLADALLGTPWVDFDEAAALTRDLGGVEATTAAVTKLLLSGNRIDVHRAALAQALAALEAEASRSHYALATDPWPAPIQRHVRRLAALGAYTLTGYDHARLTPETENLS